jgi:hypothetical protein
MASYGTPADVAARLPRGAPGGGAFDTGSKPSITYVQKWLDETSATFDGRVKGAGFDPTLIGAGGLLIVQAAVTDFVAGLVERYWGGEDLEVDSNATGRSAALRGLLARLKETPEEVALELGLPPSAGTAAAGTSLSSFWTNEGDGKDLGVTPDRNFKVTTKF